MNVYHALHIRPGLIKPGVNKNLLRCLQAVIAGITSVWEVTLYPVQGNSSPPKWVVTMGRNSAQAIAAAVPVFAAVLDEVRQRQPCLSLC